MTIEEFENLLRESYKYLKNIDAKNNVMTFIIGITGSGKSTLVNYLKKADLHKISLGGHNANRVVEVKSGTVYSKIGHDLNHSETSYPIIVHGESRSYCDRPGFFDTRNGVGILSSIYNQLIINSCKKIESIVVVIDYSSMKGQRSKLLKDLVNVIHNFLKNPENQKDSIIFAFSHVEPYYDEETEMLVRLTETDILLLIEDIKKSMANDLATKNELAILNLINKNNIVIINPTDKGQSRKLIESMLEGIKKNVDEIPKNAFDFTGEIETKKLLAEFTKKIDFQGKKIFDAMLKNEKRIASVYASENPVKNVTAEEMIKKIDQFEKLINEKSNDINKIRGHIRKLNSEYQQKNLKEIEETKNATALTKQLELEEISVSSINQTLQKLQSEKKSSDELLSKNEFDLNELIKDNNSREASTKKCETDNEDEEKNIKACQTDIDISEEQLWKHKKCWKKRAEKEDDENGRYSSAIYNHELTIINGKNLIAQKKETINKNKETIKTNQLTIQKNNEKAQQLNNTIARTKNTIQNKNIAIEQFTTTKQDAEKKQDTCSRKLRSTQDEITKLKQEQGNLKDAVHKNQLEIKTLEGQLTLLENEQHTISVLAYKHREFMFHSMVKIVDCFASKDIQLSSGFIAKYFEIKHCLSGQTPAHESMPEFYFKEEKFDNYPSDDYNCLKQAANKFGFQLKNVLGDGRCFFRAIEHQLKEVLKLESHQDLNYIDLYDQVIIELIKNIKHYQNFCNSEAGESVNNTVMKLQQGGLAGWADNLAIQALANVLNMKFIIIADDFTKLTIKPNIEITLQLAPKATLYLGYQKGWHYQSLVRDTQLSTNLLNIDSQPDGNFKQSIKFANMGNFGFFATIFTSKDNHMNMHDSQVTAQLGSES